MGHGLLLAAAGVAAGGALAYAAGRATQSLLAGVSPADATAFGAAIGLVVIATTLGALLPAVRAARIDPLTAIRAE